MDTQIERLLCKRCGPIVAAALEVERTQQAAKLARDRLLALGIDPASRVFAEQEISVSKKPSVVVVTATGADPFKGRRSTKWRDVPIADVLRNIRGDIAPYDLCHKLGIADSVLRRRVKDIIGQTDKGKRWQKGVGYLVKGKAAWDHERDTLRIDKTKGAAMAALDSAAGAAPRKLAAKASVAVKGGPRSKAGPTDEELRQHAAGKLTVEKLARKYKCAKSTVYRAISFYKVRFGADAPHGEPKPASPTSGNGSNGGAKLPNGVKPPTIMDMDQLVNGIVNGN